MTIPKSTRDYLVVRRDPTHTEWWPWPGSVVHWCDEHHSAAAFEMLLLLGGSQSPGEDTVCENVKLYGTQGCLIHTGEPDDPCKCHFRRMWLIPEDLTETDDLPEEFSLLLDTGKG